MDANTLGLFFWELELGALNKLYPNMDAKSALLIRYVEKNRLLSRENVETPLQWMILR